VLEFVRKRVPSWVVLREMIGLCSREGRVICGVKRESLYESDSKNEEMEEEAMHEVVIY
jgi:hypothetical protein